MAVYYVTCFGDRVAGPFDSRSEAKRIADEENTTEIGDNYAVERVDGEDSASA
ncbi:hypothetical protein [Salinarchaeum laminariae]|uniref:hypothetical protein n=1 Tax=Salinarchaeum laminariae TaxID=869888 RepID=UPI0020BD7B25|nr:hypothetical protein [Salinarchaeum laminariae]